MYTLLITGAKQIGVKLGQKALNLLIESITGEKQVSLQDIYRIVEATLDKVDLLPAEITKRQAYLNFRATTSRAFDNITNEGNYEALLEFLDDSKDNSFKSIINKMSLDMFDVSVGDMERNQTTPTKIKFEDKNEGYLQKRVKKTFKNQGDGLSMNKFVADVAAYSAYISINAAIVTQVATLALVKIGKCGDEEWVKKCQARFNNKRTQKLLPLDAKMENAGKHGFASQLAPCLEQSVAAMMGTDHNYGLASLYRSLLEGHQTSIYLYSVAKKGYVQYLKPKDWKPWIKNHKQPLALSSTSESNKYVRFRQTDRTYLCLTHQDHGIFKNGLDIWSCTEVFNWPWWIYKSPTYGIVCKFGRYTMPGDLLMLSSSKYVGKDPYATKGTISSPNCYYKLIPA